MDEADGEDSKDTEPQRPGVVRRRSLSTPTRRRNTSGASKKEEGHGGGKKKERYTRVHFAVLNNDMEALKKCIEQSMQSGRDIDRQSRLKEQQMDLSAITSGLMESPLNDTALHLAARLGNVNMTRVLLEAGANSTILNFSRKTPMQEALSKKNALCAVMLFLQEARMKKKLKAIELQRFWISSDYDLSPITESLLKNPTRFHSVTAVDLSSNKLTRVPVSLSHIGSIASLNLSTNRIKTLAGIGGFKALTKLDVSDNQLNAIAMEVLDLKHLKKLRLHNNPFMCLPRRVAKKITSVKNRSSSGKLKAVLSYLHSLASDDTIQWRHLKVITVGDANVGKSTLIRRLRGEAIGKNMSTDGIDITETSLDYTGSDGTPETYTFSLWDFGGQDVFWSTHQFFLTGSAIYMVVVNLANFSASIMRDWLDQISSVSRQTSQLCQKLIVGTHCTELSEQMLEKMEREITSLANSFQHVYRRPDGIKMISIDTVVSGVEDIKTALCELAADNPITKREVSMRCEALNLRMRFFRDHLPVVSKGDMIRLGSGCGMDVSTDAEIRKATKFLTMIGSLVYFEDVDPALEDMYIMNPGWLADVMSCVFTFKHTWIHSGVFYHRDALQVWKEYPASQHASFVALLRHFELAFPLQGNPPRSLLPGLLPGETPDLTKWWKGEVPEGWIECTRFYDHQFFPLGMFGRVLVRLLHMEGATAIRTWRYGILMGTSSHGTSDGAEEGTVSREMTPDDAREALIHGLFSSSVAKLDRFGEIAEAQAARSNSKEAEEEGDEEEGDEEFRGRAHHSDDDVDEAIEDEDEDVDDIRRALTKPLDHLRPGTQRSAPFRKAQPSSRRQTAQIGGTGRTRKKSFGSDPSFLEPTQRLKAQTEVSLPDARLSTPPPRLRRIDMASDSNALAPRDTRIDSASKSAGDITVSTDSVESFSTSLYAHLDELALVYLDRQSSRIVVRVRCVEGRTPSLLRKVVAVVELLDAAMQLKADVTIPCMHCITRNPFVSPYLFPLSEVIDAIRRNSTYLYCNNIRVPARGVRVDSLAPDLSFKNVNTLDGVHTTKVLGQGAFGTVWKGSWNGMVVAVKGLTSEKLGEEQYMEFCHEVYTMSALSHPNLVTLFGITISPTIQMVLSFEAGGDMYHVMKPLRDIPWATKVRVMLDVAHGMQYLHELTPPIMHRDLRSPNVMMVSATLNAHDAIVAKVGDFGLAQQCAPTAIGILATWQWMAPEVVGGQRYDYRADVYSFAIVAWEAMVACDMFPFQEYEQDPRFSKYREDCDEWMFREQLAKRAVIDDNLRPTLPKACPPELREVVEKCWAHRPADRPSWDWVVRQLSRLLHSLDSTIDASLQRKLRAANRASVDVHSCPSDDSSESILSRSVSPESPSYIQSDPIDSPSEVISMCFVQNNVWFGRKDGCIAVRHVSACAESTLLASDDKESAVYSMVAIEGHVWTSTCSGIVNVWKDTPKFTNVAKLRCCGKHLGCAHGKGGKNVCNIVRALAVVYTGGRAEVWASIPQSGRILRWNAKDRSIIPPIEVGESHGVCCMLQVGSVVWAATSSRGMLFISLQDDAVELAESPHSRRVNAMVLKGDTVWSCGDDYLIVVWNSNVGTVIKECRVHQGAVYDVTQVGENIWSCSADKGIVIWNAETGTPISEIADAHKSSVRCICPARELVFTAGCEIVSWMHV